jgi:hypothetical protein
MVLGSTAIPVEMKSLVDRIRLSQGVLKPEDEPEDDGHPPLEETWQRASRFVLNASLGYWGSRQAVPPTPAISAGPEASIDIVWRRGDKFVAANVPEEPVDIVTIYGRDPSRPNRRLRVEEDPEIDGSWILEWLMR